ncbi:MAG: hypothetical protein JWP44_154 [Mucilaginibacter sp.]|nr:hypothetical protein [Mucilaginibacter sp.]
MIIRLAAPDQASAILFSHYYFIDLLLFITSIIYRLRGKIIDNYLIILLLRFQAGTIILAQGFSAPKRNSTNMTLYMNDTPSLGYLGERKSFLRVLTNYLSKITELKQKNKELHHITETQKRIISILAHDVRNPLASIKNIIELKQSDILDTSDAAKMMDMVARQLNNTIEMVDNIVNWGQLHLQHRNLQLEYFDLNLLVERIFGSESLKSIAKHNKLINNVPQGTVICSDERALEFILRNLIGNSNKYTEGGNIIVDIEQAGVKTIFSVTDTGIGMPAEKINELLNNHTCQSTPGTNEEKGNGLGLMLVKEFVSRLGGSMTIESMLNKGTKFMIEI